MDGSGVRTAAGKRIALVAHDNLKGELLQRVHFNHGVLQHHDLFATGTTWRPQGRCGVTAVER